MRGADAENMTILAQLHHSARWVTTLLLRPSGRCSRPTRAQSLHASGRYTREIRHLRKGEFRFLSAFFDLAHTHQTQDTTEDSSVTSSHVSSHLFSQLPQLTTSQRTFERGITKGQQWCACRVPFPHFTGAVSPLIPFHTKSTVGLPTTSPHVGFSRATGGR